MLLNDPPKAKYARAQEQPSGGNYTHDHVSETLPLLRGARYYATIRLHIMSEVQDSIVRSIVVRAPIERVYRAISDPAEFGQWFSKIEGEWKPGTYSISDHGPYGRYRVYVESAEPPTYFAWRGVAYGEFHMKGFDGDTLAVPNTLVEFRLEAVDEGTRVTVTESGFASIPEYARAKSYEDNSGGWDMMVARIKSYVETGSAE
jgi:uncharacterized protein YndB with AHSA1/START domain